MATLVRKALSRQPPSPVFTSFRLHVHPRNFVSDHPRPVSSVTAEPVVETFAGPSKHRNGFVRKYATEQPRTSQASSQTAPRVETFSDPARLQPYYAKHPPTRDLPKVKVITFPIPVASVSSTHLSIVTENLAVSVGWSCRWGGWMGGVHDIHYEPRDGIQFRCTPNNAMRKGRSKTTGSTW